MSDAPPELQQLPELERDREWQRLDPRMLLVHPVRELIRFLPALIAIAFAGGAVRQRGSGRRCAS